MHVLGNSKNDSEGEGRAGRGGSSLWVGSEIARLMEKEKLGDE